VLTRSAVLDVRGLVTVAEVTTTERGLAVEVALDHVALELEQASWVNCDGIHTVAQRTLTQRVGALDGDTMRDVCSAVALALGC
jgi:mRNA interferase MazF